MDQSFAEHGYLRPDLREGYEILIDYYKGKGDYKSQVAYYDRLSQADKVLSKNYKYLSGRILKEYNNKEIVQGKRNAEHALKMQKIYYGSIIILLTSALTHFIYRYHTNQKKYRRKFEELMQRNTNPDKIVTARKSAKELDLLPDVAETIYKNLLKFEKNKKYLEKDMNLVKIAAALHTNQRYATKIIWHYRDKKTIEYITDLKIDYIVERLKNDSRFRLYTNKALGMEAGFGSTQIFTKSFKARCGMSPTFFVSELQKERNSMDS